MTMALRFPEGWAAPAPSGAAPALPLVRLQAEAERLFLGAGHNLEAVVDELHGLKHKFAALHDTLGPERTALFGERIDTVNRQALALRGDLDAFGNSAETLRGAVRAIRAEVASLDRVLRTIANVSINARIQGNSLVPARPQVTAFIRQLGLMSDQGDVILREVNDTMASALAEIGTMGFQYQDLSQALRRDVLPEIARFAQVSASLRDQQGALDASAQALAEEMSGIFADVSRLVIALQIGDSTRQRLGRVEATLAASAAAGNPALRVGLTDLALRLLGGARADAMSEIDAALSTLSAVRERGLQAARVAGRSAFGKGAPTANPLSTEALEAHLARAHTAFAALQARTRHVHDLLDRILRHEPALRHVANEIRLAGINAVITCAKLGHEGRTLRELAQWLRQLTDESDLIVQRLQDSLATAKELIREVADQRIGGVDRGLTELLATVHPLARMMVETAENLAATATGFADATDHLPRRVDAARHDLAAFLREMAGLDRPLQDLTARLNGLPPLSLPGSAEEDAMIGRMRALYTMAQERRIHDQWALDLQDKAAPVADPAAGAEDVDDIFF